MFADGFSRGKLARKISFPWKAASTMAHSFMTDAQPQGLALRIPNKFPYDKRLKIKGNISLHKY